MFHTQWERLTRQLIDAGGNRLDIGEFPSPRNLRMAGKNLLDQRLSGPRHADDKNR